MKYVGSKNRLSKQLAPIIQSYVDNSNCKGYIEPFVGGANMIDKIKCDKKYGFDTHKYLIALLQQAQKDTTVFPDTIDKEMYQYVRQYQNDNSFDDWFVGLVGFCASYNGKWFGGYANDVKTKIGTIRNYTDEAIANLKKQAPNLKNITFRCRDFRTIKPEKVSGYVIYCDPPYRGTTKYVTDSFPYDEFYEWCRVMSKNNVVLISEYWMPDDFECIWEGKLKCTLDKDSRTDKVERLFKWREIDER